VVHFEGDRIWDMAFTMAKLCSQMKAVTKLFIVYHGGNQIKAILGLIKGVKK
jgi:hypothetical protein